MKLPDDLKREISRTAYHLAQASWAQHRRDLEARARALLAEGMPPDRVLAALVSGPATVKEPSK